MKKRILFSFVVILALSIFVVGIAGAQEPAPPPSADEVNDIAKNMFCPVCENIPLDVCPTEACELWREEISDLLILGFSEDEIYEYFYERHGDVVLATPTTNGFNLILYILLPLLIGVGLVFLIKYLRGITLQNENEKEVGKIDKKDDIYLEKLEDELKKRN